jgi:uncharacterized delta-60 repeat protein
MFKLIASRFNGRSLRRRVKRRLRIEKYEHRIAFAVLNDFSFGSSDGYALTDLQLGTSDQIDTLVQSDGKIVFIGIGVGATGFREGANRGTVAVGRMNVDGTRDITFGEKGSIHHLLDGLFPNDSLPSLGVTESSVLPQLRIVQQSGERTLISGYKWTQTTGASPSLKAFIIRLTRDGALDTTFGPLGNGSYWSDNVVNEFVDAQDRIYLIRKSSITRLTSNGTIDGNFGAGGTVNLSTELKLSETSQAFVNGSRLSFVVTRSESIGGIETISSGILQLTPRGRVVRSFGENGFLPLGGANPFELHIDAQSNYFRVHDILSSSNSTEGVIEKRLPSGELDVLFDDDGIKQFNFGTSNNVAGFTFGNNEYYLKVHERVGSLGAVRDACYRIDASGEIDPDFKLDAHLARRFAYDNVFVTSSGLIFSSITSSNFDPNFYRVKHDGSFDTAFGTGLNSVVRFDRSNDFLVSSNVGSDGSIYSLAYGAYRGSLDSVITKHSKNGELDKSFGIEGFVFLPIASQAERFSIDEQDRLLIGTSNPNGFRLWRFTDDGMIDQTFGRKGCRAFEGRLLSQPETLANGDVAFLRRITKNGVERDKLVLLRNDSQGVVRIASSKTLKHNDENFRISEGRVLSDGSVIAKGSISQTNSTFVARFASDGKIVSSYGINGSISASNFSELVLMENGQLYATQFLPASLESPSSVEVIRFDANGQQDSSYKVQYASPLAHQLFVLSNEHAVLSYNDEVAVFDADGDLESQLVLPKPEINYVSQYFDMSGIIETSSGTFVVVGTASYEFDIRSLRDLYFVGFSRNLNPT